jgi:pimeloyl-ACP methyl ester carboxylesterase
MSGWLGIECQVSGQGRPVVLHGFPDSGRLWRHQAAALAEAGHQVVPDLRLRCVRRVRRRRGLFTPGPSPSRKHRRRE